MRQNTNSKPVKYGSWGWQSSMLQRTEYFRMSDSERELAAESLRDGEKLADLILQSGEKLRSAAAHVGSLFLRRAH
ncbi:MAG TPA: hypothetical protein VLB72_07715 [Burkholderiales bacterium]|nr:hypothetical protein [Burkholderiales bacterium]